MGSHRSSVDQPGCESSEIVEEFRDSNSNWATWEEVKSWDILCQVDANLTQQQNVVLSSSSLLPLPPSSSSRSSSSSPSSSSSSTPPSSSSSSPSSPSSLPSQPLPATAAASTIPSKVEEAKIFESLKHLWSVLINCLSSSRRACGPCSDRRRRSWRTRDGPPPLHQGGRNLQVNNNTNKTFNHCLTTTQKQ